MDLSYSLALQTLVTALRRCSEEEINRIYTLRSDIATAQPKNIPQLAGLLLSPESTRRSFDTLDAGTLFRLKNRNFTPSPETTLLRNNFLIWTHKNSWVTYSQTANMIPVSWFLSADFMGFTTANTTPESNTAATAALTQCERILQYFRSAGTFALTKNNDMRHSDKLKLSSRLSIDKKDLEAYVQLLRISHLIEESYLPETTGSASLKTGEQLRTLTLTQDYIWWENQDWSSRWSLLVQSLFTATHFPGTTKYATSRDFSTHMVAPLVATLCQAYSVIPAHLGVESPSQYLGYARPSVCQYVTSDQWDQLFFLCQTLGIMKEDRLTTTGRKATSIYSQFDNLTQLGSTFLPPTENQCYCQSDGTFYVSGLPGQHLIRILAAYTQQKTSGLVSSFELDTSKLQQSFNNGETAATIIEKIEAISITHVPESIYRNISDLEKYHTRSEYGACSSFFVSENAEIITVLTEKLFPLVRRVSAHVLVSDFSDRELHEQIAANLAIPMTHSQATLAQSSPKPTLPEIIRENANNNKNIYLAQSLLWSGEKALLRHYDTKNIYPFRTESGQKSGLDVLHACLETHSPVRLQMYSIYDVASVIIGIPLQIQANIVDIWNVIDSVEISIPFHRIATVAVCDEQESDKQSLRDRK